MKKRLAYCIPTRNHTEVLAHVFQESVALFARYGIDIYVYDSSKDDKTKELVDNYISQGYSHLYYIRLGEEASYDEKTELILSGYGLQHEYEYIWPIKDRSFTYEFGIQKVLEAMLTRPDVIFFGLHFEDLDSEYRCDIYDNSTLFYDEWGWLATSVDVTIFRVDTLLDVVDWEKYKQNYYFDNENMFNQYTVLFDSLAKLEKPSIYVLQGNRAVIQSAEEANSFWKNSFFKVWTNLWVKTNTALPTCYDNYKEKVIKQAVSLPWILSSVEKLIELQEEGILNSEEYERLQGKWSRFIDIPEDVIKVIADGDAEHRAQNAVCEIERLFQEEKYAELYTVFQENVILLCFYHQTECEILEKCFQIYLLELQNGVVEGIFAQGESMKKVLLYYQYMRECLLKLASDTEESSTVSELMGTRNFERILPYILTLENIEPQKIMNKMRQWLLDMSGGKNE